VIFVAVRALFTNSLDHLSQGLFERFGVVLPGLESDIGFFGEFVRVHVTAHLVKDTLAIRAEHDQVRISRATGLCEQIDIDFLLTFGLLPARHRAIKADGDEV